VRAVGRALERVALAGHGLLRALAWLGVLAALLLAWHATQVLGAIAGVLFAAVMLVPPLLLVWLSRLLRGLIALPRRVGADLRQAYPARGTSAGAASRPRGRLRGLLGLAVGARALRGRALRARGGLAGARVALSPVFIVGCVACIGVVLAQLVAAAVLLLSMLR
jgi:hypothetical protein